MKPTTVLLVERRLTHYRMPLFDCLREELDKAGVALRFVHGQPTSDELKKGDEGSLSWAERVTNRYWRVGGKDLCWQPLPDDTRTVDLVILNQENSLLSNYPFLFRQGRGGPRVAFFGHGANLQSSRPNGLRERFKRWTTNRVDWWFAYTQMSADLVMKTGFLEDRITVLNNAVDTSDLRRHLESVTPEETHGLRKSLGFGTGPVGVFVGSLYAEKRLDFLFAAAEAIRREVPDFHLLIVGEGPEREKVQGWCAAHPWVRWVGTRFGREKAAYVSMAQVMLNPGLVGLGILDSFVAGVPMVTTDCGIHSPEIAYLDNGRNGIMTANDLDDYATAVVALLRDVDALCTLSAGCEASGQEYTVENMVAHFADGIVRCLNWKLEA